MTIPKKIKDRWEVLRSPGDAAKMAERMEKGYAETFNRAFRLGRCSDEIFKIMAEFYEEKASVIKEYI